MREVQIELGTIEQVNAFVRRIEGFDGEFDILSGRYVIDAKSVLGIFSVDLSRPLTLRIENEAEWEEIEGSIEEFRVL